MIFQRANMAEQIFHEKDAERLRLINLVVEILKRNKIGENEERQRIIYLAKDIEILKKIVGLLLFMQSNECPNFRTIDETKTLVENLLISIEEDKPLLIFALFCPSYKKDKGTFGFNQEVGETTKRGVNNLDVLSKKATLLGIKNESYAVYSDLVLENFDKLKNSDFEDLAKNFNNFVKFGRTINPFIKFIKISQIGNCESRIGLQGSTSDKAGLSKDKIKRIVNRSKPFYKSILGWGEESIEKRTVVLSQSCSIMGEEISKINPLLLMVMTENIYERGIFYYSVGLSKSIPIFYPHKTETKIDKILL